MVCSLIKTCLFLHAVLVIWLEKPETSLYKDVAVHVLLNPIAGIPDWDHVEAELRPAKKSLDEHPTLSP